MSVLAGSFSPGRTMPPLRELAPQPMVWASKMATDAPPRARDRAAERPVKPAPITATSRRCGNSRATGVGICTVSSQKVFSLMVMCVGVASLCCNFNRELKETNALRYRSQHKLDDCRIEAEKAAGLRRLRPALQGGPDGCWRYWEARRHRCETAEASGPRRLAA